MAFFTFFLILWRIFRAEVKHGCLTFSAGESTHGLYGYELAATFAVFHDAANAEGMIEDRDGVADLLTGGSVIVEDSVVRFSREGGSGRMKR